MDTERQYSHTVYVVSDATGATARRVVEAALAQFEGTLVEVEVVPGVVKVKEVKRLVKRAALSGGTIVHTLAIPKLRQVMLAHGRRHHVTTIDLMGPLVDRLRDTLELSPLAKPGLLRQLDESYFERIGAIDFTVTHDDGRNPEDLVRAQMVLVGVSRTSKTPISIYLSYRGWRVANVPLVVNLDPPAQLLQVDRRRVIALTVDLDRLVTLRKARTSRLAAWVQLDYASRKYVQEELEWSELLIRANRWATVDVTNKSIEECASEIVALYNRRMGK
jgi:regulator of PEP synthase PpsR (kinase-PPPase family)